MQRSVRLALMAPGLVIFFGCFGLCSEPGEGANPGECSDGADNDEDGEYDCDDEDCAGSPVCDGVEGDTDTDSDADSDADTDTAWGPGDWSIDVVTYGYDSSEWFYEVRMEGWASEVTLDISQDNPSPWEEYHEFVNVDYDPSGDWDLWSIELPITSDWYDQRESVNTLYQGSLEPSMVWRVEASTEYGDYDCVVWSGGSASIAVLMESGCRELEF